MGCTIPTVELFEQVRQDLLKEIAALKTSARKDTAAKIRFVLQHQVETGAGILEALEHAGYTDPRQTLDYWAKNFPEVQQLRRRVADFATQIKGDRRKVSQYSGRFESPEALAAHQSGLLFDPDRELPVIPGFADFRWEYLGFPTAEHHAPAVAAMEDMTNLVVFVFGPPGMGKDTLAGHYVLWRAPHRTQTAFFMESEKFAARRGRRIDGYLTTDHIYKTAPGGVPGSQIPSRNMIYDFGPFAWKKGMLLPDGTELERPIWNQYEKYYVGVEARESEPDLWFTGVGGATYGSRIQDAILSDLWPPDRIIGPDELQKDFTWVQDTLETRLDDDGRMIVLGTMLPWQNNYARLVQEYTDGAVVIDGDQYTEKWSNGTCVVKIPAIQVREGIPVSYWPVKFPLESRYEVTYKNGDMKVLPMDDEGEAIIEARRLQKTGEVKAIKPRRGLLDRKRRNPINFRALYMQEDVTAEVGDFTDNVLDMAYDHTRTFGRWEPHETLVVGVDPAKTFGAAWWLWAVNTRDQKMTMVDFGFHESLGVQGIKDRLVVEPITNYHPAIFAFEINRHEAVLEDPIIQQVFRDFGVKVYRHHTGSGNRAELGILATLMRVGQVRFPAMTKDDQNRLEVVRTHFKAYDLSVQAQRRSKPGTKTHIPDDIAFAAWIGSLPARELLEGRGRSFVSSQVGRAVPSQVLEKWNAYKQSSQRRRDRTQPKHLSSDGAIVSGMEVATMFAQSYTEAR